MYSRSRLCYNCFYPFFHPFVSNAEEISDQTLPGGAESCKDSMRDTYIIPPHVMHGELVAICLKINSWVFIIVLDYFYKEFVIQFQVLQQSRLWHFRACRQSMGFRSNYCLKPRHFFVNVYASEQAPMMLFE